MASYGLKSIAGNLHAVQHEYPPLTVDEEKALCEKYADDLDGLRERLVLHNVGFAVAYVRKYNERTEDQEDMWMRGLQGLSRAAQDYDPSQGVRFCSFAGRYIQCAMRDLFGETLSGPKTQRATRPVYDVPDTLNEDEVVGDYLAVSAADPCWEPARPGVGPGAEAKGAAELAEYFARRYGKNARERDVIRARLTGWTCEKIGDRILGGVSRFTAHALCARLIDSIRKDLRRLKPGDELYGVCNRAVGVVPGVSRSDSLYGFFACSGLELVDEVELETVGDMRAAMVKEYDVAEAEHRLASGRYDGGADYTLMRAVYMDSVVGTSKVNDVAERRGLPPAYAWFLRDRAVEMVRQSKDGTLRRMVEKRGIRDCGPAEHHLKDELFNVTLYPEISDGPGGRPNHCVLNYGALVERLSRVIVERRARKARRGVVTTWKNYRGGFYGEANYLRLSGRVKHGKVRLTRREARALALFCDDVSTA